MLLWLLDDKLLLLQVRYERGRGGERCERGSHGSRDSTYQGAQNQTLFALGQRPKRAPRQQRQQTSWDMDEISDHDQLVHQGFDRLQNHHASLPIRTNLGSSNHQILADHIVKNMDVEYTSTQQKSTSADCKEETFPIQYGDYLEENQKKKKIPALYTTKYGGGGDADTLNGSGDNLAQGDSDVIVESSEDDLDENWT